jgi:hypothetical protein
MDKRVMKIQGQSFGLLIMLAIQFILGMILNLFVSLPKTYPGQTGNYFSRAVHGFGWAISNGGGIVLLLHVVVAILLLLASLSLMIRTAYAKNGFWVGISIVGAIGVILALTNGLAFIGYDSDVASFVMAMGFITATLAYGTGLAWGMVRVPQKQTKKQTESSTHKGHSRPAYTH